MKSPLTICAAPQLTLSTTRCAVRALQWIAPMRKHMNMLTAKKAVAAVAAPAPARTNLIRILRKKTEYSVFFVCRDLILSTAQVRDYRAKEAKQAQPQYQ